MNCQKINNNRIFSLTTRNVKFERLKHRCSNQLLFSDSLKTQTDDTIIIWINEQLLVNLKLLKNSMIKNQICLTWIKLCLLYANNSMAIISN